MKFELSQEESNEAGRWMDQHKGQCKYKDREYWGAIGGRYHYEIIPTSIGQILNIRCTCGERGCLNALDL